MNKIILNNDNLDKKYPSLGGGAEGSVYNYNNQYAIKIFQSIFVNYHEKDIEKKRKKIELLSELKDKNFCFPLGAVSIKNHALFGYYMKLVQRKDKFGSLNNLMYCDDYDAVLDILIKADEAIERIHKEGIVIGDVIGTNILIDKMGNPMFVDTDNYAYQDCDFDLKSNCLDSLETIYGKKYSREENDRFVFAVLAMQILTKSRLFYYHQDQYMLNLLIDDLQIDPGVIADLQVIFSDKPDRPHIGPILKRIKNKNIRF